MWIIVGLGNPGSRYDLTRHNIGFGVIEHLATALNIKVTKKKHHSLCGEGFFVNEKVLLAKPQTFMNLSGMAVADLLAYYKVPSSNLLVCYDDLDLPLGRIRLRAQGSSGGHNGIKSIIEAINTQEFPRLRVGIGRPSPDNARASDYVLSAFTKEEICILGHILPRTTAAIQCVLEKGITQAMNEFNREQPLSPTS